MRMLRLLMVASLLVIAGCAAEEDSGGGVGPVPADEAQVAITYTVDGTSFAGDHQIVEGPVTVTFSNETDSEALVAVFRYQTGSPALAKELEFLDEGERGVPSGGLPVEGWVDVDFADEGDLVPGTFSRTMDLVPGTYLFDVGSEDFLTTGLWRAAVIEVVAK